MSIDLPESDAVWQDAGLAAALIAVDPIGLGGAVIRAQAGPVRDAWLRMLRRRLPAMMPLLRVPLHISENRLLGGLDLAATLAAGRPVAERGVLAQADGGLLLLGMAERVAPNIVAHITGALDTGRLTVERDAIAAKVPCRIGVIAFDEGIDKDEAAAAPLCDRMAFHIFLDEVRPVQADDGIDAKDDIEAARRLLPDVQIQDDTVQALCAAAQALGIDSIRGSQHAVRAAKAAAALHGRKVVNQEDAAVAARLVLAPRAVRLPAQEQLAEQAGPPEHSDDTDQGDDDDPDSTQQSPLEDQVLAAAQAAIPAGLLAQLKLHEQGSGRSRTSGRSGVQQSSRLRGRAIGVRRGELRSGQRLDVLATLRAAAPWQALRKANAVQSKAAAESLVPNPPILVRREDFHVKRLKQRSETTTIFVVDASGSAALHRLAEAKGAVELLLADCYIRRDRVAVLAFRGKSAELLLPPTRSLVRAKRSLAGLPGGGGTPFAAGISAAAELAESIERRGETAVIVFLTDGRANIALDGSAGRGKAEEDALRSCRQLKAARLGALLIDTSPQAQPQALRFANEMNARYLPLPYAGAAAVSQAVRSALVQSGS